LFADPLEDFLNGRAVADESAGHGEATGRNIADRSLDIVRNPLDEMTAKTNKAR
jgi:hypothetical protein